VDLQTDSDNCGACGTSCGNLDCVRGACDEGAVAPPQQPPTVGPPQQDFCDSTGGDWPVEGDDALGRLSCSTPTITGLARIQFDVLKTFDVILSSAPGGSPARAAIYGLDSGQIVVCQAFATIATGRVFANCPDTAVTWLTRIETNPE